MTRVGSRITAPPAGSDGEVGADLSARGEPAAGPGAPEAEPDEPKRDYTRTLLLAYRRLVSGRSRTALELRLPTRRRG